ncbi:MAG: DUF4340 domain-containing protein [Prolixibacteraceae bacterium]|nr:DUF4340 domain-containing protein [Prolixibacteraceae bacterium]MBN2774668.1 DUF4340 domain-containing protein [Prolixibacteraceae bacterium]
MFRRVSIKSIIVLFIVLFIAYIFVAVIDSKKGDRTFRKDLVDVSTEEISEIRIFPRILNGESVILLKEGDLWVVKSGEKSYNANQSLPVSMIDQLNSLKPMSLAGNKKDQWNQYEVTDSLGTKVQLIKGGNTVADLIIGKFSYQTQKVTTYIRLAGEKEIYGVEGFLSMTFNREIKAFRDQTIIKGQKSDWIKLTFTYPADSSFILSKSGDKWQINNVPADSLSVSKYLNQIANLSNSAFAQNVPSGSPTHTLLIEGNNMMNPIKIEGYYTDEKTFIINSNLNEGTYFNSPDISNKIFISKKQLINQ